MSARQFELFDNKGKSAGHCTLDILTVDGFGTSRTTQRFFASMDIRCEPVRSLQLAGALAEVSEVYLRDEAPVMHRHFAIAAGRALDSHWPMFEAMHGRQIAEARLAPLPAEYQPAYRSALDATEPDPDLATHVDALNAAISNIVEDAAWNAAFARKWGVVRVLNAGSTSRGTYLGRLVDFDPVIETSVPVSKFDARAIADAAENITRRVEQHPAYASYLHRIGLSPAPMRLASAGIRGRESFVARFEIEAGDARHNLLDITFGRLPQLTGYEIWFQRFLNGLAPGARAQLRKEIRLAKKLIRAIPGLYGSAHGGFRAHLIEQWIIQSANYRAGQFSLDNALRLLAEEAALTAGESLALRRGFTEYKKLFPVWHPGWWEKEAGLSPAETGVNLFDLLGNGNPVQAEQEKWPHFAALGPAHLSLIKKGTWTLEALIRDSQTITR